MSSGPEAHDPSAPSGHLPNFVGEDSNPRSRAWEAAARCRVLFAETAHPFFGFVHLDPQGRIGRGPLGELGRHALTDFPPVLRPTIAQPVHAGPGFGWNVRGVGHGSGLAAIEEDLLRLVVVAGDAGEQRFDRGGVGYVAALLHRPGELGMSGDPLADGAAGHAETAGQIVAGSAARAEVARAIRVFGLIEGWASGTGHGRYS